MTSSSKSAPNSSAGSSRLLHEAVNPGKRAMSPEDLWAIPRVGAPEPAPDGSRAVVPVTTYDLQANEGRTRLWLVSASEAAASSPGPSSVPGFAAPRPLTSPDVSSSSPRISPDGTRLAFLRKPAKDAKPQLYLMSLDGGEAEKLTDMPLGAADPRWFPCGRKIAFLSSLYREHPTVEATRAHAEAKEKDPVKAHVTEDRLYRYWDRWLTDGDVPHIFLLDLDTKELRDLTPAGSGSPEKPAPTRWFELMDPDGHYDISPAGDEIVFSANASAPPHTRLRWAIWSAPAAGGEPRCLTPDNPADDIRPRYTPDGAAILFGQQIDPFFYADRVRLVRLDRASGRQETLTGDWDRSAGSWEIAADGQVFIEAEDRGGASLFRLPPASKGAAQPPAAVPGVPGEIASGGVIGGLAVAAGRIFYTRQDFSHPAEVFVRPMPGAAGSGGAGSETRLTRFTDNALEGIARGEVREVTYAGANGVPIQMFLVMPPGGGPGPHPLVHVIHGGPHGISGDQWHPRWNAQLFAAPGYAVACVNFHGSTSFGQEFAKCIQGSWGDRPTADIEAATDWLIDAGVADSRAMAIAGGSYGGYLVAWIGSQTNRYACIVNHAGVYDLLAQYSTDVTQGRHASFGGEPWDGLDRIDRWSPSRVAKGLATPMLVVHGERDYRVPVFHGLEVYNILKAKGVEARLVYFPDENHWVLKPRNSVFWYREVHEWLARFLRRNR